MTAFPRKRFYKTVRLDPQTDGVAVLLDGKPLLTPARAPLLAPTKALAAAIAGEWESAGEKIDIDRMALTRLAMTASDSAAKTHAPWSEEILKFARSDLLCYRAAEPEALVRRQEAMWSPFLGWAETAFGARLAITAGLAAIDQPHEALAAVAARVAALDKWRLLGTRRATEICGSAILALALEADAFAAADILAAARLDENFQAERWGWDAEAVARETRIAREFDDAARFLRLTYSAS